MRFSNNKIIKLDYFFFLLLIIANFILIFYILHGKNYLNEKKNFNSSTSDILVENMSSLKPFELQSEGIKVSHNLKVASEEGDEFFFYEILGDNTSMIIYRFSETHCDVCVDQHISILKKFNSIIKSDDLVLLSSFNNLKKIKIVRQTYNLDFRIYNITDELSIPLEYTKNPYFFILNKNLVCDNFFSAIKENPDLTISCIKVLIEKIYSKESL